MKVKKSRKYEISGSKVSFTFDREDGKIVGISKNGVSVNPNTNEFSNFSQSDEAINAYNVAKYTSNKRSYVDSVATKTSSELNSYYTEQSKKETNEQFVEEEIESSIASNVNSGTGYQIAGGAGKTDIMAYPLDINPHQDHFKITKYEYVRPDINQSKSYRQGQVRNDNATQQDVRRDKAYAEGNIAGDGVINSSKPLGSILLPMPKATDVNGVEWGKSELTISGLAALGAANALTGGGRFLAASEEERKTQKEAKELLQKRRETDGTAFTEGASALYTQTVSKLAGGVFGVELDADTVLARQGGRVLNPNAEMLFQGPVIRDFAFSFIMIARSQKEGNEIRKIIRFLKLGMAPKFRTTTYLKAPDVFTLQYKNGTRDADQLKTVNQFNPGGLALTTMNVDYAPNGYWSAYRDSQPVALKMDLNFTELRPIYEGDQANTPEDSVGY